LVEGKISQRRGFRQNKTAIRRRQSNAEKID